jgi:excinuclease ABC subunit C
MMREVFRRRLKYGNLPDVFVVDGGVAQVNTVRAVLKDFEVEVPVVGIAKSKNLKQSIISSQIQKSEERLVIPNRSNPYVLKKCPSLFRIIVQMRDEAHRFSRKLHHKAEKKRIIKSWVDDVKGIGPEVRSTILKNLTTSKDELKKMNVSTIKDYLGVRMAHARAIYNYLHESN